MSDEVNHPRHYNDHPSGVETCEVTDHLNFNLGNAIKYAWRMGLKPGQDQIKDLRKCEWYLTREMKRLLSDEVEDNELTVVKLENERLDLAVARYMVKSEATPLLTEIIKITIADPTDAYDARSLRKALDLVQETLRNIQ